MPIIEAMGSSNVSAEVNQPTDSVPDIKGPDPDAVVCETTEGSPTYFDCAHAFDFSQFRDNIANKGKKDEDYWQAVSFDLSA